MNAGRVVWRDMIRNKKSEPRSTKDCVSRKAPPLLSPSECQRSSSDWRVFIAMT